MLVRVYNGGAALSDFRKTKLLQQLQRSSSTIYDVQARYVHFIDTTDPLSPKEDAGLRELLTSGVTFDLHEHGTLFLVTPRVGTISSWSSKATDIARNAGLSKVIRIERAIAYYVQAEGVINRAAIEGLLHDRMTETVHETVDKASMLFATAHPRTLTTIDILQGGRETLMAANTALGLALSSDEVDYLYRAYQELARNPTDIELMMFGSVNSEHCRHKIFNAKWLIDGKKQSKSLFKMIQNTYEQGGQDVLSAYSDNAAVLRGKTAGRFFADPTSGVYTYHHEPIHSVIKVETHNHPTAIAPIPGAATGTGGEIRDEGATGRGAKPKMGLAGFSVSNLNIPGSIRAWEQPYGKPGRIVSALDIILTAPLGAAAFANEFGRPNLAGYFRTYEQEAKSIVWGYHKPIMLAGGLGNIREQHVQKRRMTAGAQLIVLGGPAMLIGLGGGAASSMRSGASNESLDFASVQRANAEMERRVQEVIDHCWALGGDNPLITIHDVGAGGLSNALPELVHDSGLGAVFELRDIPNAELGLSPLEIWCNEAQERYVLGIAKSDLARFQAICERERCPFAVVGETTTQEQLVVHDQLFNNRPVDLSMATLFGKPPKMLREISRRHDELIPLGLEMIDLSEAIERVLHVPSVGSKKFLITIGDRNVGGLVVRDQMIGPWQVPVSDAAITAVAFDTDAGEAMAIGERAPLALINAPASARVAIGEAITNIMCADIEKIADIKLSANWMAAAGFEGEDEKLFDTVKAVGETFCPALGLTIPVGKDSLSMRTAWKEEDHDKSVTSPLSLVITAFAPVEHVGRTITPQLSVGDEETTLIFIDLGQENVRLGGSALAQAYNQVGDESPDVDPVALGKFFDVIQTLRRSGQLLAYHDRSDGGLITTLLEMAFASRCGLEINLESLAGNTLEKLFNEELGAVIQIKTNDMQAVLAILHSSVGLGASVIGRPVKTQHITLHDGQTLRYQNDRAVLERWWSDTSYQLQRLRDNPDSADQEYAGITASSNTGPLTLATAPLLSKRYDDRPKVAIFREQGVNGHVEMAAAFDQAGFTSIDVHLSDLLSGRVVLDDFTGLVACGGFSYGDVLGAGEGWAKTILFHKTLRAMFSAFFARGDTFTLGVCNGCQMLSSLKELIPGAGAWPTFLKNTSEQFEARQVIVQINESPSIFFKDMAGSLLPIPVAHGEGRAAFKNTDTLHELISQKQIPLQYIDNTRKATEHYPANPNGSPQGVTAITSRDGRATIMMPHPERAFMTRQLSWHPDTWGQDSPWLRLFQNAREWIDDHT